ncbi:HAMP domain-containing histidine kinase [Candidatus Poribacteria bacterium]|nr:HAMP domain-containing histidine kinase [Candidatus Poribacteria bacterium]
MFFKRQRTVPTGYAASNFLLTYFVVGLVILSLAFVYYTRRLLQHNEVFVKQVEPLAHLTAVLLSLNDGQLQSQLSQIINKELLTESRLSFIMTDADDGQVQIAKNLSDKIIEKKIDDGIPLSDAEKSKLIDILNRMKRNEPIPLHNFMSDGYLYHGEADANAIDRLPFVITDLKDNPRQWKIWDQWLKAEIATPEQYERAKRLVHNSKAMGRFVLLQTNPGRPLQGHLYYEVTPDYIIFVMPIVLVVVFSTILIVGFLSYRRIKTVEQASIWGGLAKETAHQLGTPISSLMGWVELSMELDKQQGDSKTTEIYANMQSDLTRLQRITERFGKIGSYPQQTRIDINTVIGDAVAYFQKRLPNLSKQVELRVVDRKLPEIVANADLLQWVFENLIRNSLDAIDKENGVIEIDPRLHPKEHQIVIRYRDNGQGIPRQNRNKIFRPGMTTKKHGWGLGLTLVKRIIEAYHHGQIRLVHTSSQGTTFEIVLPVETAEDQKTAKLLTKVSLFWMKSKERKKGEQSVSAKHNT